MSTSPEKISNRASNGAPTGGSNGRSTPGDEAPHSSSSPILTLTNVNNETAVVETGLSSRNGNSNDDTTLIPASTLPPPGAMIEVPGPPQFTTLLETQTWLKGQLAAAFRIFAKFGFDEGVAGHITMRDPIQPNTFWVNPFGLAFALIHASDLIQVSSSGAIIAGRPGQFLNPAAFMIHYAVHESRPDVLCVAHAHSLHGRAFCTLGIPLKTATQDDCVFYEDLALYTRFAGIVLEAEEGIEIARCLGGKKAALLANHGLLTVGQTIEEAVFWFVSLEKCCRVQLLAMAAGEMIVVGHDEARKTADVLGNPRAGYFCGKPLFDVILHETQGAYLK
ncbi:MAG: hypothetical protein M1814_000873 [Vezdaea aestivalis]|nr:MAG: hypothetical protein M1814_000873 [Vezdaea aestivalis]